MLAIMQTMTGMVKILACLLQTVRPSVLPTLDQSDVKAI